MRKQLYTPFGIASLPLTFGKKYQIDSDFFNVNLKTWLTINSTNSNRHNLNISWCTIFVFTLRSIWTARNNFILRNTPLNQNFTVNSSLALAAQFWSNSLAVLTPNPTRNQSLSDASLGAWEPLLTPWLKLNCDGSSLNYRMGFGGCLRNAFGN